MEQFHVRCPESNPYLVERRESVLYPVQLLFGEAVERVGAIYARAQSDHEQ